MAVLDGLITFYSWHHALRAEKVLRKSGFHVSLIPVPREISSNCGTALCFEYHCKPEVIKMLVNYKVRIDSIHIYTYEQEHSDQETTDGDFIAPELPTRDLLGQSIQTEAMQ